MLKYIDVHSEFLNRLVAQGWKWDQPLSHTIRSPFEPDERI